MERIRPPGRRRSRRPDSREGVDVDRTEAFALVNERIPSRNLVNHSVAVECIMEALAHRFDLCDEEVEAWALAGLLHDLDYAETGEDPGRHGLVTAEELRGVVDDRIIHAILGHADKAPRESRMDRALYAADPTTGFIIAAALVRPDKDITAVALRSLLKRWKEKAFARGASREQMDSCTDLGLTREEFLALSLAAMQARASDIGFA
jgi:putative nucleotidyltransferase with HDIG domain